MLSAREIEESLDRLERWFGSREGVLVAFSGGVDSSLVAFLARHYLGPKRSLAVISASPSLKMSELDAAREFARRHNIPLQVIVTREMENPDYTSNPSNRCYFCKNTLYIELETMRREYPGWCVVNGQNVDDLGDYRPGIQAAREHEVAAPLSECGITKEKVRALAAHFGLECWDKPASPCLSSRVPYGQEVTMEKLRQIEKAESFLNASGYPVCRVRHFGDTAQVEVPPEQIESLELAREELTSRLQEIGFAKVRIDPEGFVSGKLNRALG